MFSYIRTTACAVGIASLLFSCTQPTIDEVAELKKPVISAYIYTARTTQQVRITPKILINESQTKAKPIINAKVQLIFGSTTLDYTDTSRGYYRFQDFTPTPGTTYTLSVSHDSIGFTATATTTVPELPKFRLLPDTFRVPMGQPIDSVFKYLANYPKLLLQFENGLDKPNIYHTMSLAYREPDSSKAANKIYSDSVRAIDRRIGRGPRSTTFKGDKTEITLRRIGYLGRYVITMQRFDDTYSNFLVASQNQGSMNPGGEQFEDINVEDMTVAPSNVQGGMGVFCSFSTDSISFYVQPQ